jgi:hypothetical protein
MVGLDKLCEDLVAALAGATGVHAPAQPGSPEEPKQVAALAALVSLAAGPEAALLGSGWVTILRVLSALEALQVSRVRVWIRVLARVSAGFIGCCFEPAVWKPCR